MVLSTCGSRRTLGSWTTALAVRKAVGWDLWTRAGDPIVEPPVLPTPTLPARPKGGGAAPPAHAGLLDVRVSRLEETLLGIEGLLGGGAGRGRSPGVASGSIGASPPGGVPGPRAFSAAAPAFGKAGFARRPASAPGISPAIVTEATAAGLEGTLDAAVALVGGAAKPRLQAEAALPGPMAPPGLTKKRSPGDGARAGLILEA